MTNPQIHTKEQDTIHLQEEEYDAFISLGSSCLIAFQLLCRGLRQYSLPLDYVFSPSNNHIKIVTRCFINRFKNFFLYDNLVELTEPEERGHGDDIQYKDIYTEFRFIHHFNDYISNYDEYLHVKSTFERRIARMYNIIEKSKKVLLLSDSGLGKCGKNISPYDLLILQKNCSKLFPNTTIHIHFTEFINTQKDIITMIEYTPEIRTFYAPQRYYSRASYEDVEYSRKYHSMYNYLLLSERGKEIASDIHAEGE